MRGRGRGWMAGGVVALVVGACLTAGTTTGAAAPPPPLPLVPGVPTASSEITPVAVPPAPPVDPEVEREALTAPAPSPDSAGARQATSPDPLKLVAVTWTGTSPRTVELRSRLANGAFGPWTRVDLLSAEREGRPTPVSGTEPMWVADSRAVQVRATETNGASATKRMALTSIDPKTTVNDAAIPLATTSPSVPGVPGSKSVAASVPTPVPSATVSSASPAGPKIVTRAQWGADEKLMTWAPEYTPTVRAVTIHHTAGTNDYTAADSAAIVRGIYAYHAKTQGWGDIGYHALVDRFGTLFEGRAGGLDKSIIAAHAAGFNKETFGVAIMGDLTSVAPNSAAMAGVARIAGWKLGGLYRDPKATVTLTSTGVGTSKYAAGQAVTLPTVFAHRDVGRTECPGNTGYRSMGTIRDRVAAAVGDLGANPIRTKWLALRSTLGEPSAVESDAANGGRATRFQNSAIYWTAATRAWSVRGAILTHWSGLGAERSTYGYPRSDQYAVSGGTRQDFQNGSLFVANGSSTVRKA